MLADHRALEEQAERENPINPKGQLMRNKNGLMSGGSATPSMGLSEFRGGRKMRARASAPKMTKSEAEEMGEHLGRHIMELHGGSFHKDFIKGMSGGAWYDFLDPNKNGVANAFNSAGSAIKNEFVNPDSVLRKDIVPKVTNEITNPDSVLRSQVIPKVAEYSKYAEPFMDAVVPGSGEAVVAGAQGLNAINQGATQAQRMLGYGDDSDLKSAVAELQKCSSHPRAKLMKALKEEYPGKKRIFYDSAFNLAGMKKKGGRIRSGAYEGMGMLGEDGHGTRKVGGGMLGQDGHGQRQVGAGTGAGTGAGRRKRAPAQEGSGRNKRAEIVRKVMKEKGMKMIEASKYVKQHGLY